MTPKELGEYAKVCRKHGIAEFTLGATVLKLDLSFDPSHPTDLSRESDKNILSQPQYSEEELLSWSAGPVSE
jgi:hypothetical protein